MLKERLKELRRREGITQTELARALQVSVGAVGNWESGKRKPDLGMMTRIADCFCVSVDYLTGRTPLQESTAGLFPVPPMQTVPLLGDIMCGEPILAEENAEAMVPVPMGIPADFCLRCRGDSMTGARVLDGDRVYIRRQETVEEGQIAAVLILPVFFGLDGIWWSIVAAELAALVLTVFCIVKFRGRYHYL